MGNKPLLGIGLALLLLVLAVGLRYFAGGPMVKDLEYDVSDPSIDTVGDHHLHPQASSGVKDPANHDQHNHGHAEPVGPADQPRHVDMLSPEMKQAIRDQLFHHGPKKTVQLPNGMVIMPHEGRVTQMPVAVEMPDGTIQIKEYAELPE